jgi:hypothetical protein
MGRPLDAPSLGRKRATFGDDDNDDHGNGSDPNKLDEDDDIVSFDGWVVSGDKSSNDHDDAVVVCNDSSEEEEKESEDSVPFDDKSSKDNNGIKKGSAANNAAVSVSPSGPSFPTAVPEHWGKLIPPLIPSFPRLKFPTKQLPPYDFNASTAPKERDSVITFETMGREMFLQPDPLRSHGIVSLQSYLKGGRGLLWQNRSSCKLHYKTSMETFQSIIIPMAKQRRIPHKTFYLDGGKVHKVVDGENNTLLIVSSGTFDCLHDRVCFQDRPIQYQRRTLFVVTREQVLG